MEHGFRKGRCFAALSTIVLLLVIASCGGGGGGDGDGDTPPVQSPRFWGTAELLEVNSGVAFYPQIAMDDDGNAIAVWQQHDGARYNIWAKYFDFDGGAWRTAEQIETNAYRADNPQIAMDETGYAVVVWSQQDASFEQHIWSNEGDGTVWGATAAQIEFNGIIAEYPQIAMGGGGVISVWSEDDGIRKNIWAFTGLTPTTELISDDSGDAFYPQIAMSAEGTALAVWHQWDGTRNNICGTYYDGTEWGPAVRIEYDDAGSALYPQIAMDDAGKAIAVWQQSDDVRFNIWARYFTFDGRMHPAEQIESNDAGDAQMPQIVMDGDGNAIAVWRQYDGVRFNIWANYFDGTWGTAELIETDDAGHADNPQIAMDSAGNAIAVWRQHDGTRYNLWANYFDGTWGTAELIETDNAGNVFYPQIAMDAEGNGIAVWQQSDGTRDNIWANRFE